MCAAVWKAREPAARAPCWGMHPRSRRARQDRKFAAAMGWESNCARRPGASSSASALDGGKMLTRGGMGSADENMPLRRGNNGPSLAESHEKKRDDLGVRDWSKRKHVCVALMFVAGLWVVCFGVTVMSIEALLRVTS